MNLTPATLDVLQRRYLARDEQGTVIETPEQMFSRVARAVGEADRLIDPNASPRAAIDAFEEAMTSFSFLPNSPCLVNAGRPMGQLAACFVLPVEDNLEAIFQTLKDAALIHQTGGGVRDFPSVKSGRRGTASCRHMVSPAGLRRLLNCLIPQLTLLTGTGCGRVPIWAF